MVNGPMLEWARAEAGYALEQIAQKIHQPVEKLRAWETGTAQPTLPQAERLAKLYERPLSLFSLSSPPQIPALATEYRRLPGVRPGAEAPELRLAVRRLVHRRRLALNLYSDLGDDPPEFPLRAHLRENVEDVGERIRAALDVPVADQLRWVSEFAAFRTWRVAVEHLGVLVCQMPGKGLGDVRGTAIVHFPLPVIGLSSKDLPLSKPFTLLHEFVHLALAAADEEKPASEENRDEPSWLEVERFCEGVAGAILMPRDAIQCDEDVVVQRRAVRWDVMSIRRIAKHYRVTPTAVATRLLRMRAMTPTAYAKWKEDWQTYRETHPDRPSFGIASPAEKAVSRNGPLFTSLVLSALSNERISSVDACHYLDLGFGHVETLRRGWIEKPTRLAAVAAD